MNPMERDPLREAAQAVVDAWVDDESGMETFDPALIDALAEALDHRHDCACGRAAALQAVPEAGSREELGSIVRRLATLEVHGRGAVSPDGYVEVKRDELAAVRDLRREARAALDGSQDAPNRSYGRVEICRDCDDADGVCAIHRLPSPETQEPER